jgi:hypothetical protein
LATAEAREYNGRISLQENFGLACPFFLPTKKYEGGGWPHPSRLPLGGGWHGICTAAGAGRIVPSDDQLQQWCNLGYAQDCPHLPLERTCDAVRFAVVSESQERITLCYACESGHRPGEQGRLEYVVAGGLWTRVHGDARIQKMAECYLQGYLEKTRAALTPTSS